MRSEADFPADSNDSGPPRGPVFERLDFTQLSPDLQEALGARVERLGYLGEFFKLAGHQPGALLGFVHFTESLKEAMPARLTEVVALSVSTATANTYERHQHERLSLALGFGEAWLREVLLLEPDGETGPTPDAREMSSEERAVQRLTLAAVTRFGRGVDAELASVAALLDQRTTVGVVLTIGRYMAHAVFANTFGLEPPVPSPLEQ